MTAIIGSVDFRDQIIPTGDDFPVTYGDGVDSDHVFVRVGMDDGTVGYGEGTALPWFTGESAPDMAAVIERWLEPRIRGKTVVDALVAFDEFTELFPGNPGAKAAVEMALLDLRAKRLNVRMADLLGMPRRDSVPVDFTIPGVDPETTAEIAGQEHKNGFTHIKVKATGDIESDIARIDRSLRPSRQTSQSPSMRMAAGPTHRRPYMCSTAWLPRGASRRSNSQCRQVVKQASGRSGTSRVSRCSPTRAPWTQMMSSDLAENN